MESTIRRGVHNTARQASARVLRLGDAHHRGGIPARRICRKRRAGAANGDLDAANSDTHTGTSNAGAGLANINSAATNADLSPAGVNANTGSIHPNDGAERNGASHGARELGTPIEVRGDTISNTHTHPGTGNGIPSR